jgi:hypothetical protein
MVIVIPARSQVAVERGGVNNGIAAAHCDCHGPCIPNISLDGLVLLGRQRLDIEKDYFVLGSFQPPDQARWEVSAGSCNKNAHALPQQEVLGVGVWGCTERPTQNTYFVLVKYLSRSSNAAWSTAND